MNMTMNEDELLRELDKKELEDLENESRCDEIVVEINTLRKCTMRTVLISSVEIGRLLCEAKEKLPHGSWGDWLKENFEYSQSTANNLMRLYSCYGEKDQIDLFGADDLMDVFGHLTPSQALALIALPEPERRDFVETHDMEKTSVRDIEAEIRARKEAEARAEEAENRIKALENERDQLKEEVTCVTVDMQNEIGDLEVQKNSEIKKLQKELKEAQDPKALKDKEKELKKKIEEKIRKESKEEKERLEKELAEAKKAAGEVDALIAEAEKKARDGASAEYMGKLLELENRARNAEERASIGGNAKVQKFAVLFESWQRTWQDMKNIVTELAGEDEPAAKKLSAAMLLMIEDMKGALI